MNWQYGVTTVPQRADRLLPQTLRCLSNAGFRNPWIFVDGAGDGLTYTTLRLTPMKTVGHWLTSLTELYYRNPTADRYAIFQDDIVCYRNLRDYLDACCYPTDGYWNLYTIPYEEERLRSNGSNGWAPSDQYARGALALVFDVESVRNLLTSRFIAMRPVTSKHPHGSVDGMVQAALKPCGRREYVHLPSLVQHVGGHSTMLSFEPRHPRHNISRTFIGEDYDALNLLQPTG